MEQFRELYDKIVPPAQKIQIQMEDYMREHAQMKQIIHEFDATMSAYALKYEIVEYSKELRKYVKARPFEEHCERTEARIEYLQAEAARVKNNLGSIWGRIEDEV